MSRKVKISFDLTAGNMVTDAYKAAVKQVEKTEKQYASNPDSVTDVAAKDIVITGTTPYKVYAFKLTIVKASGEYTFEYVGEAPNVESLA